VLEPEGNAERLRSHGLASRPSTSESVGHGWNAAGARRDAACGVSLGNPVLAVRDSATGELRGVAIDIVRELAARAG